MVRNSGSTIACPADTREDEVLRELRTEFEAEHGYITYESPPPNSVSEFIEIATGKSEQRHAVGR
jgi:hypothetical protein